jgi:hypothetical protein
VRQAAPETAHFPSKPSAANLNKREPFGLLPQETRKLAVFDNFTAN